MLPSENKDFIIIIIIIIINIIIISIIIIIKHKTDVINVQHTLIEIDFSGIFFCLFVMHLCYIDINYF